jgi:hypothetical protein
MRTDKAQHAYYCGIDRHARSLYLHILDDKCPAPVVTPRGRAIALRSRPAQRRGFWGVTELVTVWCHESGTGPTP